MPRPVGSRARKDSVALRLFAQESLVQSVETQLLQANRRIAELEALLESERARGKRLDAENRRLRENWQSMFSQGIPLAGRNPVSSSNRYNRKAAALSFSGVSRRG